MIFADHFRELLQKLAILRQRSTWVWLHRWVGLVMAVFLIIAGLTGSLLAFYKELDAMLNPELYYVSPPHTSAQFLDPVTIRERVLAQAPYMTTDSAISPYHTEYSLSMWLKTRSTPHREEHDQWSEWFINPYTGEILGHRNGELSQGIRQNLMPFIYRLHYALALGDIGRFIFGIIALLWTLDCFVGAYLTFPKARPFLKKWQPAWQIKPKRFNYDLHRASGLWTWLMLFVLAWSSVAFNLPQIYYPITKTILGFTEHPEHPERNVTEQAEAGLSWQEAYVIAQNLMNTAVVTHQIEHYREDALRYDHHRVEFNYWVATKFKNGGMPYDWFGVTFDANTGELLRINEEDVEADKERAGDFITRWLLDLHMAHVWGMPFRIFVCFMGIVVATLSVTGIIIWWRKRSGQKKIHQKRR